MSKKIPYAVGMRYQTRCGYAVKVIHHIENPEDGYVVCGIMRNGEGKETLESWTTDGRYARDNKNPLDLLPIDVVDYEAMAKQLAIALRDVVRHAESNIKEAYGGTSLYQPEMDKLDHAKMWLGSAQQAGLIP